MTMILVDKLPQNCGECPLSWPDNYFSENPPLRCNFVYAMMGLNESKRHEDCPLKSVDGLIEKLNHCVDRKLSFTLACNDLNERQKHMGAVDIYRRCISIIKEYCEMEDE